MQKLKLTTLILACLITTCAMAQDNRLMFQNGVMTPEKNLQSFIADQPGTAEMYNGYYYRFIQFNSVPTEQQKVAMEQSGIVLLQYMPHSAFMAAIPKSYNRSMLGSFNVRSVVVMNELHKINKKLLGDIPAYAINEKGKIDVRIQYMQNIDHADARNYAAPFGTILSDMPSNYIITLRIAGGDLFKLAQQAFVYYIDAAGVPSTPDDTKGRSLHRSNVINADYVMGRHYDGSGVAAALADDGIVGPHIDFTGRLTNHLTIPGGFHGDMTSGILAGAGNLDPVIRGMANGVQLHVFDIGPYPQIIDAVANNTNYGTVVSSTSYSQGCNEYTTDTQFGDQTLHDNPQLEFVFSAGNNQGGNCNYGAGAGWGVITGGYKQGKNVIACANLDASEVLDPSSSRGPASDGRIKPEISSNGRDQMSTDEGNTYQVGGGTSAACPGIAGICTQLIQAYKELNTATDAPTALIKACLLNGAEDIGNPGPDYTYGYGRVNALRAVQTLEDNRYFNATVAQGATNTHTITVPANVLEMRVMVYWHDQGGNPASATALINDLDMVVTDPSSTIWEPWILDPTPVVANLTAPATRNTDHLNNIEQVTIANPAAGSYTVSVNGFAVPLGPQEYYLVYEFRTDVINVTYPIGGEGFVPFEQEVLRWDAVKGLGAFNIDYSVDNGLTWTSIATNVNQNALQYTWNVPNNLTGEAGIRVCRGAVCGTSLEKFSIIGTPANLNVDWACPDSIHLSWDAVAGAAWYEISVLGAMYMDSVGTSATTDFVYTPVNGTLEHWFGCRAIFANGSKGRRCISIYKTPGVFSCPIALDATVNNINSPGSGTLLDCQNNSNVAVSITIGNTGLNAISNIPVHYRVNGGAIISDVYTGTIAPSATAVFNFVPTINLSVAGNYLLEAWSELAGDGNIYNDTSSANITVISGVLVSTSVVEPMESFVLCSTNFDCEATLCPLSNGWINETNLVTDDIDFRTNEGGTPSANTGPDLDHTTGSATGNYVYLEASNGCFFKQANLLSPCIDLTGANSAQMTFWYHMYGANMGELHADVYSSGVWTSDVITAITGDQGNQWLQGVIDLTPYLGNIINVRFRGITGNDFASDLALDDINVDITTGINETSLNNSVFVFPNPSTGIFNLVVKSSKADLFEITLHDVSGKLISSNEIEISGNYSARLDLRNYSRGVYWMSVKSSEGVYRTKLVIL
ncbi:MAG: S8 family serine peptidase [Bacteroidia bacterium]